MKNTTRNYGIDVLRIIAMLGVVFLHVLGHGGILDSLKTTANYSIAWFIEILAYPAVNCFVLISGYVGYRGEKIYPRLKNIISIFLTSLFYSVSICLIFKLFRLAIVDGRDIFDSFFPMNSGHYWFLSVYFGMFLLSPLLNMIIWKISKKQTLLLLITILIICAFSPYNDPFSLVRGYSLCWFLLLYCTGAFLKKYNLASLLSAKKWFFFSLFVFAVTWATRMFTLYINDSFLKTLLRSQITTYVSIPMFLVAVGGIGAFSKINIKKANSKFISFFSISTFSVYLIHENPYIIKSIISKAHQYIVDDNVFAFVLSIICAALIIFIVCILIDKIRILLFKVARVDKLSEKIEDIIKKVIDRIYRKFDSLTQ